MNICFRHIFWLLTVLSPLLFSCVPEEKPNPGEDIVTSVIHYRVSVEQEGGTRATLNGINQYVFELGDELYITGAGGDIFGFLSLVAGEGATMATFEGDLKCINDFVPESSTILSATLVSLEDEMHTCINGKITGNTATDLPKRAYATTLSQAVQEFSEFTGRSTYASHSFRLAQQMSFLIVSVAFDPDKLTSDGPVSATLINDDSTRLFECDGIPVVNNGTEKQCDFVVSLPSGSDLSNATLAFSAGGAPVTDGSWDSISQTLVKNNYYTIDKTQLTAQYFTIEAREDDTTIKFNYTYATHSIQYSTDNGVSWTQYLADTDEIPLNAGESIQVQGTASKYTTAGKTLFVSDKPCYIYGDIMTLIWGADYDPASVPPLSNSSSNPNNRNMFEGLFKGMGYIDIPPGRPLVLPSSTTQECYSSMFEGCTSLTRAPELPASEVKTGAYRYMFKGCSNLTAAPSLPATTVGGNGYREMFMNCTSLISAPAQLRGTTYYNCCYSMFEGCSVLAIAPRLYDDGALGTYCYSRMFCNCTSLVSAPDLPATSLADGSYSEMFRGCTSMVSAPMILPSSTLTEKCYYRMFYGCSSLTNAPVLPATNDVEDEVVPAQCYREMFYGCSSLNRLPLEYSSRPNLPLKKIGVNGCSSMFYGCTKLVEAPELQDLTVVGEAGCQSMFRNCSELTTVPPVLKPEAVPINAYREMFYGCPKITETPDIRATTMGVNACKQMFYNCIRLRTVNGALLPSTLAESVYSGMFYGCTSLTTAPELTATNLGNECYKQMFQNSGLTKAPNLPATTLKKQCYMQMFSGCKSLKGTVYLPAGTLKEDCYDNMFEGASQFNSIICLATSRTPWEGDGTDNDDKDLTPSCTDWLKNVKSTGTFYYAPGFGIKGSLLDPYQGWVFPDNSGIHADWLSQAFRLDPIFPSDNPFNPEENL